MKKTISFLLLGILTASFADTSPQAIVYIDNTTEYHAYVKLIEANSRTECSNEISVPKHQGAKVYNRQLSCDSRNLRLKVYGMIEANAKTSNVFHIGSHCKIRIDKPLDDRFHVSCE